MQLDSIPDHGRRRDATASPGSRWRRHEGAYGQWRGGAWTPACCAALMLAVSAMQGWALAADPAEGDAAAPVRGAEPAAEREGTDASSHPGHREQVFDQLLVTGGAVAAESIPGAADFLDAEQLARQGYGDVHRILRQVPGVNLQEEEGYGLRPNIGMRGTGVERSQKVTLLEDGVLIAPAPYSAPAAYYVPTAARMESVEVRKGSAAIAQGPYTTGGVINFVSQAIPAALGGVVELVYGSQETLELHAHAGDSSPRWGWLLETFQLDTEGFKQLDGGGPTGVRLEDYLGKLRLNSGSSARRFQLLELKLGRVEQAGEETYLGLTQADFDRTPYRRYAASQADRIDSRHDQRQLRYFVQPKGALHLIAALYRNDFFRNWYKLQSVAGVAIGDVLAAPERHAEELAVLRGERDERGGALRLRSNRRDYRAQGIETLLEWRWAAAEAEHRLQFGMRLHEDREDRFQEEDRWDMIAGRMARRELGLPGSQSNRIDEATALALFVKDSIAFGRWLLSPGVRFESIDFRRRDFGTEDPARRGLDLVEKSNHSHELMPGLGVSYSPTSAWSLFGGVHRGFAPPGPGQDPKTRAEESWNLELGFRYRRGFLSAKAVAFLSDYDNLLGRDTLSSGGEGTGEAFNGGAVEVTGLEAAVDHDLGQARGWKLRLPWRVAYTYTEGQFRSSFTTDFADWAPEVRIGDHLPYLPTHQLAAGLGIVAAGWDLYLDVSYADAMRTSAGRGPIPAGEGTEESVILDAAFGWRLRPGLRLRLQGRNLTDEARIVARRPAGARPGRPRTLLVGVVWEW